MLKALAASACVGIVLALSISAAEAAPRSTTGQPIYFPHTKSYYELIEIGPGYSIRGQAPEIKWERAEKWAMTRVHRGTRGRLAVVKDAETMEFLRQTFNPHHKTWIGLRYFCRLNRLLWTDGNEHSVTAYRPWTKPWRTPDSCQNSSSMTEYAPVFISSVQEGFRWQAHGQPKEFNYLFVEYPTGNP